MTDRVVGLHSNNSINDFMLFLLYRLGLACFRTTVSSFLMHAAAECLLSPQLFVLPNNR
ncbi:MAG TPA: hypothetical protein DEF41_09270 [Desulfovibrio sp.]|uniref:Uncharacterized protein n=1 Tax=Nitratidesulfovibrio vulgaris (strain ATCC 29579 / DSM 644 / CCUG 34227 / NCIMB 8303 / VKM B-1760 / Hildenborough) TaxID=882 RepID=Q72EK8_NITV2|nr:hypothetical protein DVU_0570 [Nitratidesulfovibrio vulgaris str. Hildenborough]HBW16302.1 hypothetical protein [Desulfovibrio sp.]